MSRPAELFAVGTILLLVTGLASRLVPSANKSLVTIAAFGAFYAFPPEPICFLMAAFFAVFAALYSIWLVPLNHTAGAWHFWLSAAGAVLLSATFVGFSRYDVTSHKPVVTRLVLANFGAYILLLAGQGVFVANLVVGLLKGKRP